MASTNVSESKIEQNTQIEGNINLDNIEFPEGPEDHAPELEIVKLENKSDSDDDSDSSELVVVSGKMEKEKKKEIKKVEIKKDKEEDQTPRKGKVGLNNMGNTCYLNAVLQTISNMNEFRGYLFKGEFVSTLKKDMEESLFYQLYRIVKHLWETTSDSLSPKSFREKFIEKQKLFYGYEQQDSNEAIQFLLDNLHEEIARKITINYDLTNELSSFCSVLDNYFTNKDKFTEAEKIDKKKFIRSLIRDNRDHSLNYFAMKYLNTLSNSYSEICDYFGIINCQLKKCPECNHIKYNFEQNYMLHISLPELDDEAILKNDMYKKLFEEKKEELKEKVSNDDLISKLCVNEIKQKYVYNLNDLLIHNQIPEIMDEHNLWNCNNCLNKVRAIAQPKLFKTPKYLIIHFKRFKNVVQNGNTFIVKLKNLIKYEKILDVQNLMIKETPNTKYELISGINHMGEYSGGHFYSFANNDKKWLNYNDDRVSDININDDDIPLSQNAYMLIYKQCD
jgi:ubiquitin C-terminal hydrolase